MKKLPVPAPRPNRISFAKHRQDVTRQIVTPIIFVTFMVGIFAALVFFATFFQAGDVGRWASVAIIWMVIPLMLLLLVILAVAAGLVALLTRTLDVAPRYTGIFQAYVLLINAQIILWTDRIIAPLLKTKSWLTLFSKDNE